jgi:hypothetical protein
MRSQMIFSMSQHNLRRAMCSRCAGVAALGTSSGSDFVIRHRWVNANQLKKKEKY